MVDREIAQKNAKGSPLLILPAELRNIIWELVVGGNTIHVGSQHLKTSPKQRNPQHSVNKGSVHICCAKIADDVQTKSMRLAQKPTMFESFKERHNMCGVSKDKASDFNLALLSTCTQIHREAALLPFTSNTFAFLGEGFFSASLYKLALYQRKAMQSVTLLFDTMSTRVKVVQLLGSFSSLKRITIFLELASCLVHWSQDSCEAIPWDVFPNAIKRLDLDHVAICAGLHGHGRKDKTMVQVSPELNSRCLELEARLMASKSKKAPKKLAICED